MLPDHFFRISFVALLVLLTVIRLYFKYRAGLLHEALFPRTEKVHFIIARAILGVPLLMATFLYIFSPEHQRWTQVRLPLAVRVLGLMLAAISLVLLVWVHRALGSNFHTSIVIKKNHQLVTEGPYRFVRHPMYSTYFIFFASLFLTSQNFVIGLCGVAIILILMTLRLRYEEALLIERFPNDYRHYRETTAKFIPIGSPRGNRGSPTKKRKRTSPDDNKHHGESDGRTS